MKRYFNSYDFYKFFEYFSNLHANIKRFEWGKVNNIYDVINNNQYFPLFYCDFVENSGQITERHGAIPSIFTFNIYILDRLSTYKINERQIQSECEQIAKDLIQICLQDNKLFQLESYSIENFTQEYQINSAGVILTLNIRTLATNNKCVIPFTDNFDFYSRYVNDYENTIEVQNYIDYLQTNFNVQLDPVQITEYNNFINNISSIRSKIIRLNLFNAPSFATVNVPFLYNRDNSNTLIGNRTDTLFNFISSDYNKNTGLQGNGVNKYIDLTVQPSTQINNFGCTLYVNSSIAQNSIEIGAANTVGGTSYFYNQTRTALNTQIISVRGNITTSISNQTDGVGEFTLQNNTTVTEIYRGVNRINFTAHTTQAALNRNLFLFANNLNGTPQAGQYSQKRLLYYCLHDALSKNELRILLNSLHELNTKLNRTL